MKLRLTIDRFEGDDRTIAVLLTEEGASIDFPKGLLPRGAKAGDVLSVSITRDLAATRDIVDKTRQVQEELKKSDPGGDIKL